MKKWVLLSRLLLATWTQILVLYSLQDLPWTCFSILFSDRTRGSTANLRGNIDELRGNSQIFPRVEKMDRSFPRSHGHWKKASWFLKQLPRWPPTKKNTGSRRVVWGWIWRCHLKWSLSPDFLRIESEEQEIALWWILYIYDLQGL